MGAAQIFLMAMLKITQVNYIELGRPEDVDRPSSKEEALLSVRRSLVFAQARIDLDQIATEKNGNSINEKLFVVCRYRHQLNACRPGRGRIPIPPTPQRPRPRSLHFEAMSLFDPRCVIGLGFLFSGSHNL